MTRSNLIMTLAKVIIAAAWADGEVSHDEINCLKDLLFHLPDITGREWAMLELYLDSPVGEDERMRLVEQLTETMRTAADRDLAVAALENLIAADGVIDQDEKQAAKEIRTLIDKADVGLFGALGRTIRGPLERRSAAISRAPNREEYLEDFIKNKVYYGVRRRLDLGDEDIDVPEADLRKLSLAGGMMARIAHVDEEVTDDEFSTMVKLLQDDWELSRDAAAFVTQVAVTEISKDLDYFRLTREFFTSTKEDERLRFVDMLFHVAAADGMATYREIEEIRLIAQGLKLTHKQFIDSKLKLPKDKRAS